MENIEPEKEEELVAALDEVQNEVDESKEMINNSEEVKAHLEGVDPDTTESEEPGEAEFEAATTESEEPGEAEFEAALEQMAEGAVRDNVELAQDIVHTSDATDPDLPPMEERPPPPLPDAIVLENGSEHRINYKQVMGPVKIIGDYRHKHMGTYINQAGNKAFHKVAVWDTIRAKLHLVPSVCVIGTPFYDPKIRG